MARLGWAEPKADPTFLVPTWVDRHAALTPLRIERLDAFARALATTDGTVTELLEAWAGERVAIAHLAQRRGELRAAVNDLEAAPGAAVLSREVLLCGERTRTPLLHAESLIALDRLPLVIAEGLLVRRTPIGRLLRESRLETYRELLEVGAERAETIASALSLRVGEIIVSRTYRVIARGQPIMLINERFAGRLGSRFRAT